MGYYSEVAIVIRKRDAKRLFKEIAKRPEDDIVRWFIEHRSAKADIDDFDANPDGVQVIRWEAVKWCKEVEEVKYIMDFIRSLGHGNYEFMRVGEEDGDCEHEGNIHGENCLCLERYIFFDQECLPWPQTY